MYMSEVSTTFFPAAFTCSKSLQTLSRLMINSFSIEGLPEVKELYPLLGSFINVEVPIPNNQKVKFLEDEEIYLGNQVECLFHEELFFGIVANTNFIMIIQYEINGENPELILYQKR